ncbi:reverse transcriptase domain-containing protein [Tanacetum coccineum]
MEKTRFKQKELLPYGMLLTRLFKYVVSVSPELAFDHYLSHDRAMHLLVTNYERKTRADRGMKRPRESDASSSSTILNPPSLSLQIDVMVDDNDYESFHSNSSSHSQHISSSSNVDSKVRQNPPHESYDLNTLLSETITLQTQQWDAYRDGLRLTGQTLKNMMGGKRNQKIWADLNYKDLKAKFRSNFSQQKKFTKTHLVVQNIKQREGESTRAFITRYTDDTLQILGLHEEQQISGFVHGLRTRSLVEHLSTDLPSTYKGLMEKTYTWVEARKVATNGASNDRIDGFKRSKKSSWDNNRGQKNKDRCSSYRGPNHGLLPSLSKSPKEILATEKAARSFEPPQDVRKQAITRYVIRLNYGGKEIIFPPVEKVNNAPVIIEAKIFRRKAGQVYMDIGSSCEIIYEQCFEKLNPTIKSTRVDLKTPLVRFSGECSWSVGEVPLEITIGDAPLSRTETINFVIVRSDSSHNMLLGRTAMQRIGILVSTIHGAIKFHTEKGIRTVFLTDEADKEVKRAKKIPATNEERILSCVNAEEKIIINDKYIKPIKETERLRSRCKMAAVKKWKNYRKEWILRKVKHQTWVANPVMAKKSDGG